MKRVIRPQGSASGAPRPQPLRDEAADAIHEPVDAAAKLLHPARAILRRLAPAHPLPRGLPTRAPFSERTDRGPLALATACPNAVAVRRSSSRRHRRALRLRLDPREEISGHWD